MGSFASHTFICSNPIYPLNFELGKTVRCQFSREKPKNRGFHFWGNSLLQNPTKFACKNNHFGLVSVASNVYEVERNETKEGEKPKCGWVEIGSDISEEQKQTISKLPLKMSKRCKALVKSLICFSPGKQSISHLLTSWVNSMKPRRADWLSVLKELSNLDHPLYFEVAELALLEESFEANVRDYTKIIHGYAKQNRLHDAENTLTSMKKRGFLCDQVTLTTLVHMYSKSGNLEKAKATFEEMKLLGVENLDNRSYGSMIMAYIRAGMPENGEHLLEEMETLQIYPKREVYKALLRSYSMIGDGGGSQRVFNAIQLAGIVPDVKLCGLLINAYGKAGRGFEARIAFDNMRKAGVEADDKCVALVLDCYEKMNKLKEALDFLIGLERDGTAVGKEGSGIMASWFRRLGVVEEVELVLRECA